MRSILIVLIIACCVALSCITKEKSSLAMTIGGAGTFFFLLLLFFLKNKVCSRCHRKSPIDAWGWKRKPREVGSKKTDLVCPQCFYDQIADSEERVRDWFPKRNDAQLTSSMRETFARFKQGECFTIGLERSIEWNGIYLSDDLLQEMADCPDVAGKWHPANSSGDTAPVTKPYPSEHLRSAARWAIRQRQKYTAVAKTLKLL
jgi:hypothetical protein